MATEKQPAIGSSLVEAEQRQTIPPIPEKEYIDVPRTCRILGVTEATVRRLAESKLIDLVEYRARSWKKVRYQSVVDFCDVLRERYAIPNRRPTLSAPYLRQRDEDLLPFPLRTTMLAPEAQMILACGNRTLLKLLEEGRFECYQLVPSAPWRISRPSFADYVKAVRNGVADGHHAYKVGVNL